MRKLETRFTHRMERMTITRTRRIDYYLHTASKQIIDGQVELYPCTNLL